MSENDPIQLDADETLSVLAACVSVLANPGDLIDDEDKTNVRHLRDATVKIAKSCGMDLQTLSEFAAFAAGKPAAGVVRLLEERNRT